MTDCDGNLSVDFMVGFTIFMVAFIWVATLVPNLFLGVSAHGVDFDAVAYRTCVILTEDPGSSMDEDTKDTPWETWPDTGLDNIRRFGLAVSKETPNILSEPKVNRFFNTTVFSDPDYYRQKAIFGDYPYRFNISLKTVDDSIPVRYVGDVRPENYGFMRREVKIKHFGNATIGKSDYTTFKLYNKDKFVSPDTMAQADGNVTFHNFAITLNMSNLLGGNVSDPLINPNYRGAYSIDPHTDWINITMEDFNATPPISGWVDNPTAASINLSNVEFWQCPWISPSPSLYPLAGGSVPQKDFIYVDGNPTPVNLPVKDLQLRNNISFAFPPGFFIAAEPENTIYINLSFGVEKEVHTAANDWQGMQYLNTSQSGPWDYSYNATQVTQPYLTDAVMEVAVW
jgi:hypothetical protein